MQPVHNGAADRGGDARVLGDDTRFEEGIHGGLRNVQHGRKVHIDPDGNQLFADRLELFEGVIRVPAPSERTRGHRLRIPAEANHAAALHVDGDQRRDRAARAQGDRFRQVRAEAEAAVAVVALDVRAVEHGVAHVMRAPDFPECGGYVGRAGKTEHDHLPELFLRAHGGEQPVRPFRRRGRLRFGRDGRLRRGAGGRRRRFVRVRARGRFRRGVLPGSRG